MINSRLSHCVYSNKFLQHFLMAGNQVITELLTSTCGETHMDMDSYGHIKTFWLHILFSNRSTSQRLSQPESHKTVFMRAVRLQTSSKFPFRNTQAFVGLTCGSSLLSGVRHDKAGDFYAAFMPL